MTTAAVIEALGIPPQARVDQRVPKKLLLENGAPGAADKRAITDGIEALQWVAALKPTTIGVPAHQDDVREVLEIAVLTLTLRPGAKMRRLIELVHRAVPYLVVLIAEHGSTLSVSLAQKRWSQGERDKTVLDGGVLDVNLDTTDDPMITSAFLASLALVRQPRATLATVYAGWMDALLALQAARITGTFTMPSVPDHAAARRAALALCTDLEAQMTSLRAAAVKEKQIARQVDLNIELKRVQAAYAAARARL